MRAINFSPKFLGLSVGIFRNFGTIFGQSGLNFRDCFQIVRTRFSLLFFGQSLTMLRFGFNPGTDVFRVC